MNRRSLSFVAGVGCAAIVCAPSYVAAQTVGAAQSFAVVGGASVTAAAGATQSVINGDVGVSPGTSITGFPAFAATTPPYATHSNDVAAQQAQAAALTLYNTIGAMSGTPILPVLAGQSLIPGTYTVGAADLAVGGTLTLNGAGLYVFKVASSLTANVGSNVSLIGVDPCQVFWQVNSLATLNGATFVGNVVAQAGVTLGSNARLTGRALTTTAGSVTMAGANTITGCSSAFTPTPPGGGGSPGPVPTLSQWAVIGLSLLLALSGAAALRARRV